MKAALTPEERRIVEARAAASQLSLGSYARACMLGDAGPRSKRHPNINIATMASAVAAVNKIGWNISQLAKEPGIADTPVAGAMLAALEDLRRTSAVLRRSAGYDSNDPER